MKLSIITINYNNAAGLQRTLESVAKQTYNEIEHIIVDGASTDDSVELIKAYASQSNRNVVWSSESDKGIYHAINKGIAKATGEYVQILNSGDILAAPDVTQRMMTVVASKPEIAYGNMTKKDFTTGRIILKSGEIDCSMRTFYKGTLNHDCCYIRRDLFERFGMYDESLHIVSDWKWFVNAIVFSGVQPVYADIDETVFDASGISETNLALREQERRDELSKMLPAAVLRDYERYSFPIEQYERLRKHHLWGLTWFIERVLFKLEKWHVIK